MKEPKTHLNSGRRFFYCAEFSVPITVCGQIGAIIAKEGDPTCRSCARKNEK